MIQTLLTSLPILVCLFWAVTLICDIVLARHHAEALATSPGWVSPRYYLLLFLIVTAELYFDHYIYFNRLTSLLPLSDSLYVAANLAVYPLYYLYICTLTQRKGVRRRQLALLLPAIAGGTAAALLYGQMNGEDTALFIEQYLYRGERPEMGLAGAYQMYVHDVCKAVFGVLVIAVFVMGNRRIAQYEHLINNSYANTENKSLVPLHHMLIAFVVTSAASFVCNLVGRHRFVDSQWLLTLPSAAFSVLMFAIGYIGCHTQFNIWHIEQDEEGITPPDDCLADATEADVSLLRQRIERLMNEEQLYLQPNLKIADLSTRLATNRNYIYLTINREMKMSFSEYINSMRVAYAQALIDKNPRMPLTEVAEKSGFNSATSFYRNFKLYMHISPKAYQDKKR